MLESQSVSLDSILDAGSFNTRQAWIVFCTALAIVFDGMDIQLMGFAVPAIAKDWHLSKATFTPVLALGLFGVTLGAVFGGIAGDRLGRRRALLLNVLLFAIATEIDINPVVVYPQGQGAIALDALIVVD